MKKIYIAGKVTGLPLQETRAKFALASEELKHKGFDPVNPMEVVKDPLTTWEEAMKLCIRALTEVDGVYLLPCHVASPGAKFEVAIAHQLKIPVCVNVDGFLQIQNEALS